MTGFSVPECTLSIQWDLIPSVHMFSDFSFFPAKERSGRLKGFVGGRQEEMTLAGDL